MASQIYMAGSRIGILQQWMNRPQNIWLRRALFQVHLWVGVALGMYVMAISISGSAIVFRNEISKALSMSGRTVAISGPRLTPAALKDAIQRAYPQYSISYIWESKKPSEATEAWLLRDGKNKMRLFDPYTGKDLGDSVPLTIRALTWTIDLHINLLSGKTGREVNGIAAVLTTVLVMSGAVVWWPGKSKWRESLMVRRESNWKKMNWSLHSVIGIWTLGFVLMWSVTGIFVVFPTPFERAINVVSPLQFYNLGDSPPPRRVALPPASRTSGSVRRGPAPIERSPGDIAIRWFYYLHFGNFAGSGVKTIWVIFGLAPVALFVTGTLMWWNRVLSKYFQRRKAGGYELRPVTIRSTESRVSS
jgi:uncharacterized iron-regulated membrane protein